MIPKPLIYLLCLSLAFLVAPSVSAEQNDWEIDNRFGSGVELSITHIQPDGDVFVGEEFWISTVAWTSSLGVDSITLDPLIVDGDCFVVSETVNNATSPTDSTADSDALIRMTGSTCNWHRHVQANDAAIGTVAQVHVVGHANAFQLMDHGQAPETALNSFWTPLGFAVAALLWTGSRASAKHPVWLLGLPIAFLAVLTAALYGVQTLPTPIDVGPRYLAIGLGMVCLLVFGIAGWINRKRGKGSKTETE